MSRQEGEVADGRSSPPEEERTPSPTAPEEERTPSPTAPEEAVGPKTAMPRNAGHRVVVPRELQDDSYLSDTVPAEEEEHAYGAPGRPLSRHSPFYIGFFGAVGALLAIWLARHVETIAPVLLLVVVAMFLAVGLNPLVEMLMRRGLRRALAVLVVILGVLVSLALFVVAVAPVVSEQVATISERAPGWLNQLQENQRIQELDARYDITSRIQGALDRGDWANKVFGGVVGFGMALLSAVANTLIVMVLTLYFLASLPNIKRSFYQLAPASRRERVTYLGDAILRSVGGYVSGAVLVALINGAATLVFLLVIGLGEYAVALAVVVALLGIIPMIGATLGAVIVAAIGFATSPAIGIACVVYYLVYQQVENYFIYPKVMARSVSVPGSVTVVAALIGATLLGVVGALLAIPTAAAIQLLIREVFLGRQEAR